jgi:glycosyltransferase involved in cell wall biosynthesis
MPAVSIILPACNRTAFLKLAVQSALDQTFTDWEMVIADDGSGEEARSYLQRLEDRRVRTIWLEHSGNPSKVRNAAIAAARGDYLAFLDSDDVWAATKLEKQMAALRTHTECRWSYCACDRVDAAGRGMPPGPLHGKALDGWIFEPLLKLEVAVPMPSVVAERSLVLQIGGFDEQQRFGEFHDLGLRLALQSPVIALHECLCSIRSHDEHYSADRMAAHESWMRLYGKFADRVPERWVRSHCARMGMETSLTLARLQRAKGYRLAALRTLAGALRYSWRYATAPIGAGKRPT